MTAPRRIFLSVWLTADLLALAFVGACLALVAPLLLPQDSEAAHRLPNNGHWTTGSWSIGHYTVADWTGSNWPVYASQIKWDEGARYSAAYVNGGSSCPAPCVTARSKFPNEDPNFDWNCNVYGYTGNLVVAGGNHFTEDMYIRFNRACSDSSGSDLSDYQRRGVTCHELGHALGLNHRDPDYKDSCMRGDPAPALNTPDAHDYNLLNGSIYDHSG